jgi:hypothetical protein
MTTAVRTMSTMSLRYHKSATRSKKSITVMTLPGVIATVIFFIPPILHPKFVSEK